MKFKSVSLILLCSLLYVLTSNLSAYSESSLGWTKKKDVKGQLSTKRVKGGGGITAMENYVYLILGNNTLDFMKYSISEDTWLVIDPGVPLGPSNKKVKKGACIVNDGEYIYILKGAKTNEFYRFDPNGNVWDSLPSPNFTKGVKGGFACFVEHDAERFIYAGSGSNTKEWKRFNIYANNWEILSPETLPAKKVKVGSGLAYDGNGMIYFLLGKDNYFYALDLSLITPKWTPMKNLPFYKPGVFKKKKVKEGGCIEYHDQKVYAVKGGKTKEFWRFDIPADSWTYVGEIADDNLITPEKGIKAGKSLAYSTFASGLFCIIGSNTNEFWFYNDQPMLPNSKEPGSPRETVLSNGFNFTLSPNSKMEANIAYTLPTRKGASLKVYNTLGKVIYWAKDADVHATVPRLPAGIYILQYDAKGDREYKKLIILK
ncbi:MAG: T9SS type A sorting domain-containing protein [candidate division WOR-3 bacterium]|nr:T9SS type A sorting domain-containing protein [candidate division WOR-3 bacterium]MDH5683363.1 T9SS type A sorting domain-containing protein [candidate division WOR-3 bacterium]